MSLSLSFLICKTPVVINILTSSRYYEWRLYAGKYHSKGFGSTLKVFSDKDNHDDEDKDDKEEEVDGGSGC